MNLSELSFVLPPTTPDADARIRIFTPAVELPFGGHRGYEPRLAL
jgi:PhzF family phenazine biosynthesis protein